MPLSSPAVKRPMPDSDVRVVTPDAPWSERTAARPANDAVAEHADAFGPAADPGPSDPRVQELIAAFVRDLPRADRTMLMLHHLERLTFREIAMVLDLTEAAVTRTLDWRMQQLREVAARPGENPAL